MSPRDRGRDIQADRIRQIRPHLDKRTDAEVAKAEKTARSHAERAARDEGEKQSFLGMLFGGGK